MSKKGSITTTDYIEFDTATGRANKLVKNDKDIMGLYITISINTGLRIADILNLTWEDINCDRLVVTEQKTKKNRTIALNEAIKECASNYPASVGFIFISQKGTTFKRQSINRKLKAIFSKEAKDKNISSHSLRKSFGRRVYENNNESEKALMYLSEIFNHTSLAITRKYLGIRQEEINDIYINL